ncbi:hypothetical protein C1645_817403 [Glomus cerebriforme]|uniref:Uncharacterized protein n=1 Tax=Glomus cerebriforme TaxID=658196 RepID=A0A397T9K7_9GLOM|nr:hypothetical protein C1645_817403 [Glomus cerebriforme]
MTSTVLSTITSNFFATTFLANAVTFTIITGPALCKCAAFQKSCWKANYQIQKNVLYQVAQFFQDDLYQNDQFLELES